MAGVCTVALNVKVTGLGDTIEIANSQATTDAPVEVASGYSIIATHQLMDFADIASAKVVGVYLKAVSGTIYILFDTGTAEEVTASNAHLTIQEGEACWLPIEAGNNAGIVLDSASATDACQWIVIGKA